MWTTGKYKDRKGFNQIGNSWELMSEFFQKHEFVTVDSASDELKANLIARKGDLENKPLTPNAVCIRDVTHAARRVIKKPEDADTTLQELCYRIFSGKHSPTQMIQHSLALQVEFEKLCADVDSRVGQGITNVRAAKHRHESSSKPKGRFALYHDAYFALAHQTLAAGGSCSKKDAWHDFIDTFTEDDLLMCGMLADAQYEGLLFVRTVDDEDAYRAELHEHVRLFIRKLDVLFVQRDATSVLGYTDYVVKSLGRQRVFHLKSKRLKCFGGPQHPKQDSINACFQKMVAFTKLAIAICEAEFPSYDLCLSFSVFALGDNGSHCTATVAMTSFRRLASFFEVDLGALVEQFNRVVGVASHAKMSNALPTDEAWLESLRKAHRARWPITALEKVVMRYALYSMSTARVEQNFGKHKRVLGEQRLGATEDTESRMCLLLMDKDKLSKQQEQDVVTHARELWVDQFGVARSSYAERIDRGVKRKPSFDEDPFKSEAAWLRQRHRSIETAVDATGSSEDLADFASRIDASEAWGDGHASMLATQREKLRNKKAATCLDDRKLLLAEEVDGQVVADATALGERRGKAMRKDLNAAKRRFAVSRKKDQRSSIRGTAVWVDKNLIDDASVQQALTELGCSRVYDRMAAATFVTQDLSQPGTRSTWIAALKGCNIVSREFVASGRGPALAYKAARRL